jgi:hypothetical protein
MLSALASLLFGVVSYYYCVLFRVYSWRSIASEHVCKITQKHLRFSEFLSVQYCMKAGATRSLHESRRDAFLRVPFGAILHESRRDTRS